MRANTTSPSPSESRKGRKDEAAGGRGKIAYSVSQGGARHRRRCTRMRHSYHTERGRQHAHIAVWQARSWLIYGSTSALAVDSDNVNVKLAPPWEHNRYSAAHLALI